jgi:hypothetical protein
MRTSSPGTTGTEPTCLYALRADTRHHRDRGSPLWCQFIRISDFRDCLNCLSIFLIRTLCLIQLISCFDLAMQIAEDSKKIRRVPMIIDRDGRATIMAYGTF